MTDAATLARQVTLSVTYHAGGDTTVTLPEGKMWADVREWYIKWDTFYAWFNDDTEFEKELNTNVIDGLDSKRPAGVVVFDNAGRQLDEL
jgi:hypothetical protein